MTPRPPPPLPWCSRSLYFIACKLVSAVLANTYHKIEAREIPAGLRKLWGVWMLFKREGGVPFGDF